MKSFLHEFKEFALRGNVISLAVGMIIGIAFQGIVTSLTDNILSPIIGLFLGQNFDGLEWHILGVDLRYGAFLTAVMNFIITAFVVFLIVRFMNKVLLARELREEKEHECRCPFCITVIHPEATRCPACTSMLA